MEVRSGTAEELPQEDDSFDTVLLNGIPSYVADLPRAFREAHRVPYPIEFAAAANWRTTEEKAEMLERPERSTAAW